MSEQERYHDPNGYLEDDPPVEFTPEMRKTHTILVPMMLPIHFEMLETILGRHGYRVEVLRTTGRQLVEEGLANVHNDTCYPALLVIGQMIDALKSGKYDPDHTALMLTQTGGGCRASNYIYLLRKALKKCGFSQVPVISLNFSKLEKSSGFKITAPLLVEVFYAMLYGDMLMWLNNQCRPYEINKGDSKKVVDHWIEELNRQFCSPRFLLLTHNYKKMLRDFAAIPRRKEGKVRVGIVGEIYMKYAPLGNNNLEDFLVAEGAEPVVSGVLDFLLYCVKNNLIDYDLYGKSTMAKPVATYALRFLEYLQNKGIRAVKKQGEFRAPSSFQDLQKMVDGFIGMGAKMGEGWLLTSEMLELIHSGVNNIVCTQPFGCLPNHIVAKGMMRKIKDKYPYSNIVAVDYDPSATPINQENRLKLMLSNARLNLTMEDVQEPPKAREVVDLSEDLHLD